MDAKEQILNEIRRTAEEHNGVPLGKTRFEKETGITGYAWGKYWARFGDAVKDAGLTPNQFIAAHPDTFLIEKLIGLIRELRRFPTTREVVRERSVDPTFPAEGAFRRLGTQRDRVKRVVDFCNDRSGYEDVLAVCEPLRKDGTRNRPAVTTHDDASGEVYLAKSGRYFKIGRTNDRVRRGAELRIQLPEKILLIHAIATDDPSGVEAYWHRRFETKRMQGEWFDLTPAEVRAFKRWRRVF